MGEVAPGARLLTSGQPTADQLRDAAAAGVREVVRISTLESGLENEAEVVAGLGMNYLHIPVVWTDPRPDQLEAFFKAMDARLGGVDGGSPTLAHCAKNYRVSVFAGLWMVRAGRWDEARFRAHVAGVFEPDRTWSGFLEAGLRRVLRPVQPA